MIERPQLFVEQGMGVIQPLIAIHKNNFADYFCMPAGGDKCSMKLAVTRATPLPYSITGGGGVNTGLSTLSRGRSFVALMVPAFR